MSSPLDGPRLAPKSGHARQLVVFLHGYGADGRDLIDIGREWQAWLPDAAFVSPHAPERCGQAPTGRQWFDLTFRDPDERWRGVNKARPALDGFLDAELAALGLDESRLALVGFSQGTMMALHTGLRRKKAPAAIVGFSGTLVGPEHLGEATARGRSGEAPAILLIHGDADQVIPLDAMLMAGEALGKAEMTCQWHISMGVAHGIDPAGLRHGGLFIARNFGLPFPKR